RMAEHAKVVQASCLSQAGWVRVWRGDRAVAVSKPAVTRVSNPQTLRRPESLGTGDGSADWKSAIQQVWKPALRPKGAKQIPGWKPAPLWIGRPDEIVPDRVIAIPSWHGLNTLRSKERFAMRLNRLFFTGSNRVAPASLTIGLLA